MPFKGVFGFFYEEHTAITIPETEPLEFYSGETVKWKRTNLSDYQAPTWTLYYRLQREPVFNLIALRMGAQQVI